MSKRIICVILAVLMLSVLFAGCGQKDVSPATTTSQTQQQSTTAAPTPDANAEAFTLNMDNWTLSLDPASDKDGRNKAYEQQTEKLFKAKYPNATVQWNLIDGSKYFDILKAKIASGTTGDVYLGQAFGKDGILNLVGKGGYAADLSDQPWVSDMVDSAKSFTTYQGKVIACPGGVSGWGVFYNKKIFKDNGLELPKTWGDFLKICETLKSKNIVPISAGFKDQWPALGFFINMASAFQYSNNKNFEIDLTKGVNKITTDSTFDNIFTKFEELVTKGYIVKNSLSIGYDQANSSFFKGESAMSFNGAWFPGQVVADPAGKSLDFGFMPLPDENGNITMTSGVGDMAFVSSASKLLAQAKDFVIALRDPSSYGPFCVDMSAPALKSVQVNHTNSAFKDYSDAFAKYSTNVQPGTFVPASVGTDTMNIILKIASGKKYDKSDLEKMQTDLEKDAGTVVLPQ